ncbi:MAG: histidinol-phosphate transaminase [Theionarchaea archaeon]|nr:histidinol-phosphate transaminase [Theionarchaea archaeon]MBU7021928.1 histidinol-phosphate transaminase [Theionarchaea archaeon]MBU7035540.1 histidinol-phosphate transaminase [Theionarchaea archaeon]MBU7040378.1 histidinol-phosphate transaminase [Theionarchaea archaeon]
MKSIAHSEIKKGGHIKPRRGVEHTNSFRISTEPRANRVLLDFNESPKGCSPLVLKALHSLEISDISRYPDYDRLSCRIAEYHRISPEFVFLTNGAEEGIRCVMDAYVDQGDTVAMASPTFGMMKILAQLREASINEIPYCEDLSFPLERFLESLASGAALVVLVNPDSPTGTLLKEKEVLKILEASPESIVLIDEVYADFAGTTCIPLVNEYPNLIITRSFSKAFGLAGLRLGYVISQPQNLEQLSKVRLPFSVSSLAVIAGMAALDDTEYSQTIIQDVKREKEFLYRELESMGIDVHMTHTNFVSVNLNERCHDVYQGLLQKNILVKRLGGPLRGEWLRITVGSHHDNVILVEAIRDIIQQNP